MLGLTRLVSGCATLSCRALSTSAVRGGSGLTIPWGAPFHGMGKRKHLTFGSSGMPAMYDGDPHFPAQSCYFKEDSDYVTNVLRPKELGNWNEMTRDEKRELYRTAYNQTIIEFNKQFTGRWKIDVNYNLLMIWLTSLWLAFNNWDYYQEWDGEDEPMFQHCSDMLLCDPSWGSVYVHDPETHEWIPQRFFIDSYR